MAASIFSEIVSEGLLEVGDTSLTARVNFALKKWLESQARAFLWPQIKRTQVISLAAASNSFSIGNGANSIAEEIIRINDPVKIYRSQSGTVIDYSNIRIQTDWDGGLTNPADGTTGKPTLAQVSTDDAGVRGKFLVQLDKTTDQIYNLSINHYLVPTTPATTEVPWYPNDRTMVQFVFMQGLKYKKDKAYREELDLLAKMVMQDRLSEGMKPGINDGGIQLKSGIFR